ncbi:type II toxin-antitoxin system RatA family toxin [Sphingosinicella ginsenosidimutans]|uniref:Type II toxin-antitoxin system RatA family toxin n=1 Tax=Allosphingosinicella ginsenosidimutans TaxID=1176539 RepID=A0A5C6TXL0_9SPHN|nr:type II toxin-antitoxin system RatA family toxin [Sphingosinicella ginsenosidimutans]TXC64631.1 type II toxin-antitoxin system RatA family toxin [Sphingosinicella ginsenosidimutans]
MPRHSESRQLPWSPEQLFDLVADVGRYQEFLPWVAATRVRSNSETEMLADLIVGFKALKETFTSRVRKDRPNEISIDYVEGPLKYLHNEWRFRPDGKGGTIVDFSVDFAFRNRLFEALAGQMFDTALRRMIGAFEARAATLYGDGDEDGSSSSSAHSAA